MLQKLTVWMVPILALYAFYFHPFIISIFIGLFFALTVFEKIAMKKHFGNPKRYLPKFFVLWMLICAVSLTVLVPTHYYFIRFLVTIGMFLNIAVSFANGYCMPVKTRPGKSLGLNDWNHILFNENSRFPGLCDRFHHPLLTYTAFSLGDIFCATGVIATFIQIGYQVCLGLYSYLL